MAFLIKAGKLPLEDGSMKEVKPADGKQFTLKEMQTYVGGYIQYVQSDDPYFILCVNEEGKLHRLPPNIVATNMCRAKILSTDFIVGDALIGTRAEMGFKD